MSDPRNCPTCHEPMRTVTDNGVSIDTCDDHGVWFDKGELEQFIDRVVELEEPDSEPKISAATLKRSRMRKELARNKSRRDKLAGHFHGLLSLWFE